MDILLDSDDLLQLDNTYEMSSEMHILRYPHREATAATITGLTNSSQPFEDPFLQRLFHIHLQ